MKIAKGERNQNLESRAFPKFDDLLVLLCTPQVRT